MYFTLAIYRLNIMFRHMPVPRDTSVLRDIIIACCESVGNCQTLSKDGPHNLWIISYFVLFSFVCIRLPLFPTSFCPIPTCTHHVFCTLFSCLSIDSPLYHVVFSHVTRFLVFFGKRKVALCDPQCEFWVRPKKIICVFTVTCWKKLGSVVRK